MENKLNFSKMQGIGNDYIYINATETDLKDPSALAKKLSDRHFGIGADGLVLIRPSDQADFMMDIYNSDGSLALMCGNAIRCVGKYVYDRQLTSQKNLTIETRSGIRQLSLELKKGTVCQVTVNMGIPDLTPSALPVRWQDSQMVEEPIAIAGKLYQITCLSVGNPHVVVFLDSIDNLDLQKIGPCFEHHTLFPDGVNTEFVRIVDRRTIQMRVWERGSGETLACGTGACAAVTAAVLTDRTDRSVTVHLPGGDLSIEWRKKDNTLYMTGPAVHVFDGWIDLDDEACI